LNPEPAEVKNNGAQNIGIGFASIAAASGYLPQFQRPAKQLFHSLIKNFGQFQYLSANNQIFLRSCGKAILPAGLYRTAGTTPLALRTEQASAEVDTQGVIFFFNCASGTIIDTKFAARRAFGGINNRPAPESFRKHCCPFRKRNGSVFLLQSCEQRFYHFVTL